MNWKRGLFRAWLLMTGLWLVLIVVFFRPDVELRAYWKLREPPAQSARGDLNENPGRRQTVEEFLGPRPRTVEDMLGPRPRTVEDMLGPRPDEKTREPLESFRKPDDNLGERTERERLTLTKVNLREFALIAFSPPAILFVIGAGGLWVFRGFRRGDT